MSEQTDELKFLVLAPKAVDVEGWNDDERQPAVLRCDMSREQADALTAVTMGRWFAAGTRIGNVTVTLPFIVVDASFNGQTLSVRILNEPSPDFSFVGRNPATGKYDAGAIETRSRFTLGDPAAFAGLSFVYAPHQS